MKKKNFLLFPLFFITAIILSSCSKENSEIVSWNSPTSESPDLSESGQNPDETALSNENDNHSNGFIYLQSNEAANNSILVFRQNNNGTLSLQSTISTGGNGTGDGLGNQGAIETSKNDKWLFTVNAGSNSVSSFKITNSGNLNLAGTVSSGGVRPVSVTIHKKIIYVVNAGSDNISGYRVANNGVMTPIAGSIQSLSATGSGPAQISFSPNGRFLYVTEKATNKISIFPVNSNGVAGNGKAVLSTGQTPFGFDIARNRYLIVSNAAGGAPGASTVTSYEGINSGIISNVNGAVPNNQAAACWVANTKFGRFTFVTNTASNNISSYYIGHSGRLFLIHSDIPSGDGPTEIVVADDNIYVHVLNAAAHTISSYRRTLLGGLSPVGITSGLPNAATGIAAVK
ncbi:MAG: beta-propeller fold lactonase family protein [Ignavibacteria bacterium]|nr:beta-propeller fold lactonase family protein [Ignavibacteria bacterium]